MMIDSQIKKKIEKNPRLSQSSNKEIVLDHFALCIVTEHIHFT